jgi:N utilization substance protein A
MKSEALGKKGQNIRLGAELTGWKLAVHGESELREREEKARAAMAALPEMGDKRASVLFRLGWRSLSDLAATEPDELSAIPDLGGLPKPAAERVIAAARRALSEERRLRKKDKRPAPLPAGSRETGAPKPLPAAA